MKKVSISIVLMGIIAFMTKFTVYGVTVDVWSATVEDAELIGKVVMAEALNQPDLGKIYVIDTILNRVDDKNFPNSIEDVVKQPNQYAVADTDVTAEINELVISEILDRTDREVLFFRTEHYHKFGVPVVQINDHYFSKLN